MNPSELVGKDTGKHEHEWNRFVFFFRPSGTKGFQDWQVMSRYTALAPMRGDDAWFPNDQPPAGQGGT
jgi:hypothetical protein